MTACARTRFERIPLPPEPPLTADVLRNDPEPSTYMEWWGDYVLHLPSRERDPLVFWRHSCPWWIGREVRRGDYGDLKPANADDDSGVRWEPCGCRTPRSERPSLRQIRAALDLDALNAKLRRLARSPSSHELFASAETLGRAGITNEVRSNRGNKRVSDDDHARDMRSWRDGQRRLPEPTSRDYARRYKLREAADAGRQELEQRASRSRITQPSLVADAKVVEIYVDELERGQKNLRQRIAARAGLSVSKLDVTLARCRRRGLLTATDRGKAGGEMTQRGRDLLQE